MRNLFLLVLILIMCSISLVSAQLVCPERYIKLMYSEYGKQSTSFDEPLEPYGFDACLLKTAIIMQVNKTREQLGVGALWHNPDMERCAQAHANDMAEHGFFSVDSPVKGKTELPDRMKKVGFKNGYAGENLAEIPIRRSTGVTLPSSQYNNLPTERPHTYRSFAQDVAATWYYSEPHQVNLRNKKFNYTGIGVAICTIIENGDSIACIRVVQDYIWLEHKGRY